MKPALKQLLFWGICTTILFFLFRNQKMAFNTLLAYVTILIANYNLNKKNFNHFYAKLMIGLSLIAIAGMLVYNSDWSKTIFLLLQIVFVGFLFGKHRSIHFSLGKAFMHGLSLPVIVLKTIVQLWRSGLPSLGIIKKIKLLLIPVAIALVFFIIYCIAQPIIITTLFNALGKFFKFLSFINFVDVVLFIYLSIWAAYLLFSSQQNFLQTKEDNKTLTISRVRKQHRGIMRWFTSSSSIYLSPMLSLKNLNTIGVYSFVLLNLLLGVVNLIDINKIWLAYNIDKAFMAENLHDGTYVLIFSILLAMLVVVFFFKGNLNFYKRNKFLKNLTYLWLIQNTFLALSVGARALRYISTFGLAYKRIGVLFFLVFTLVGLLTMFLKLQKKYTTYNLLKINGWVITMGLVLNCLVPWDKIIVRHNLNHNVPFDYNFNLTRNSEAQLYLYNNWDKVAHKIKHDTTIDNKDQLIAQEKEALEQSLFNYNQEIKKYNWLSFNWADYSFGKKVNDLVLNITPSALNSEQ
jgi:hypothetical protein